MLSELYIKNFALIDELRIEYSKGLNIITGETGSGKSIMIDALSLALGKKSSKSLIRKGQKKAIVEAIFFSDNMDIREQLDQLGIELTDNQIVITREVTMDGRSTRRINGRAITQSDLKNITSKLITIHGQNEYEQIMNPANQLNLLDSFSSNDLHKHLEQYKILYGKRSEIKNKILVLNDNMDEAKLQREIGLLDYEINEITESKIKKNEKEQLKNQLDKAEHIEQIQGNLQYIYDMSYSNQNAVLSTLAKYINKLEDIVSFDPVFSEWLNTLNDIYYTLEDLTREVNNKISKFDSPELNIEEIGDRLDIINQIFRKYGNSYEEVMQYKEKSIERKNEIESREAIQEKLEIELKSIEDEMAQNAKKMSLARKETSKVLLKKIRKELEDLNMKNARLEVDFKEIPFSKSGTDQVEFLVSFNKGEDLKPFTKVASGGEISRFMLALKTVIANTDAIDSLIFDEIDTGVSGISAQMIGTKLKEISKYRQVICITHLPQIASFADTHFVVEKNQDANETKTLIAELSREDRVSEIAKMMSGLAVTDSTLQTASELLKKNSENI